MMLLVWILSYRNDATGMDPTCLIVMMLLVWILSYRNDATGMDPVLS